MLFDPSASDHRSLRSKRSLRSPKNRKDRENPGAGRGEKDMGKIGDDDAEALRFFTCLAAIVREILPCYY
jgi:hypothetical protein